MRWMMAVLVLVGSAQAEVECYRTPAMAALQVGEQEGGGYRLEFVRRDVVSGRSWATVRSCAHPEWPAVMVGLGETARAHLKDGEAVVEMGHPNVPVVAGGRVVRVVQVVQVDAMARIEMTGVAQTSAAVGERVWVRILAPGVGGEGRMAQGVVKSADVVEVGQ